MTTFKSSLTIIKPKKKMFDRLLFGRRINKVLSEIASSVEEDMLKPTEDWDSPPDIDIKITPEYALVTTDDAKWVSNSLGTELRWAVLSSDYVRHKVPNTLNSRAGSGSVVIAGRQAMLERGIPPGPGVEAANWHIIVAENAEKNFPNKVAQAMSRSIWI